MKKITGFEVVDRQGISRGMKWYVEGNKLRYVITKGDNVTHNIGISKDKFEEIFLDVLDVQKYLDERMKTVNPVMDYDAAESTVDMVADSIGSRNGKVGAEDKLELIDKLMSSLTESEIEEVKERYGVEDLDNRDVVNALLGSPSNDAVEKVNEDVLQLIYETYGFDWFTMPQFREVYDINYGKSRADRYLQQLDDRWLRKNTIPKDEREGRTKYEYKLNASAENIIREYGAFDTMDYPVYRKKCRSM